MRYSMAGRFMSGLYDLLVLGRSSQMPEASRGVVGRLAVLPLIVGGLLAASPGAGTAQCWNCGWSPFGEWPSSICEGSDSGSSDCAQIGRSHDHRCEPSGDDCEDELFALNPPSEREAIGTVMAGRMLAADTGYYFVVDGGSTVIRRKCGNALVARISIADQPLVLAARVRRQDPVEEPSAWGSGTDIRTRLDSTLTASVV